MRVAGLPDPDYALSIHHFTVQSDWYLFPALVYFDLQMEMWHFLLCFTKDESHVWIDPGNHISLRLIGSLLLLVVVVVFPEANIMSADLIMYWEVAILINGLLSHSNLSQMQRNNFPDQAARTFFFVTWWTTHKFNFFDQIPKLTVQRRL